MLNNGNSNGSGAHRGASPSVTGDPLGGQTSGRLSRTAPLRLALRKEEASSACGMSDESFDKYVRPYVKVVRLGAVKVWPVVELQRFLDDRGSSPLEDVA